MTAVAHAAANALFIIVLLGSLTALCKTLWERKSAR